MAKFTSELDYNKEFGEDNYDIEIKREYSPYDLVVSVGADVDDDEHYTFWYLDVTNNNTSDMVLNFSCGDTLFIPAKKTFSVYNGDFRYPITDYIYNEDFDIQILKKKKVVPFKFKGKEYLLKVLKEQMNDPDISFKDVMYSREENFNYHKKETVVFIDKNGNQYRVRHEYDKHEEKTSLYYEITREISPCNYTVELKNLLKESEDN